MKELKNLLSEYVREVGDYFENILLVLEEGTPIKSLKQNEWKNQLIDGEIVHDLYKLTQNENEKIDWYNNATDEEKDVTKVVIEELTNEFITRTSNYEKEFNKMLRDALFDNKKISDDEKWLFVDTYFNPPKVEKIKTQEFFGESASFIRLRYYTLKHFLERTQWNDVKKLANVGVNEVDTIRDLFLRMKKENIADVNNDAIAKLERISLFH